MQRTRLRSLYRPLVRLLAAGLLLAAAIAPAVATETRQLDRTFDPGNGITIANLAGSFEIVPGSGSEVVVAATLHAEGVDAAETRTLLNGMEWVRHKGDWTLSYPVDDFKGFAYPVRDGGHSSSEYLGKRVKVYREARSGVPVLYADLRIEMPAGIDLTVDGVLGPMTTKGRLQGELTLDTGSGTVLVESFDGELVVDTGSGDVEVRDVYGSVSVDTGSGDVEIAAFQVQDLHVDTGSGDVWLGRGRAERGLIDTGSGEVRADNIEVEVLEVDTGSGDVTIAGDLSRARDLRFDTGSGDVHIEGGPDFEFDLRADLGSGRVRVGYADADLRYDGREVVGARRGQGGTRVLVDTGSGDCTVR